jgi:hypothetical protein
MKTEEYLSIDTLTEHKSYLIIEQIENKKFVTITGFIQSETSKIIFYKSSKMEITEKDKQLKFNTDKFEFSNSEITLQSLWKNKVANHELNFCPPIKFKYTMYFLGERAENAILVKSISELDDSKVENEILFNRIK